MRNRLLPLMLILTLFVAAVGMAETCNQALFNTDVTLTSNTTCENEVLTIQGNVTIGNALQVDTYFNDGYANASAYEGTITNAVPDLVKDEAGYTDDWNQNQDGQEQVFIRFNVSENKVQFFANTSSYAWGYIMDVDGNPDSGLDVGDGNGYDVGISFDGATPAFGIGCYNETEDDFQIQNDPGAVCDTTFDADLLKNITTWVNVSGDNTQIEAVFDITGSWEDLPIVSVNFMTFDMASTTFTTDPIPEDAAVLTLTNTTFNVNNTANGSHYIGSQSVDSGLVMDNSVIEGMDSNFGWDFDIGGDVLDVNNSQVLGVGWELPSGPGDFTGCDFGSDDGTVDNSNFTCFVAFLDGDNLVFQNSRIDPFLEGGMVQYWGDSMDVNNNYFFGTQYFGGANNVLESNEIDCNGSNMEFRNQAETNGNELLSNDLQNCHLDWCRDCETEQTGGDDIVLNGNNFSGTVNAAGSTYILLDGQPGEGPTGINITDNLFFPDPGMNGILVTNDSAYSDLSGNSFFCKTCWDQYMVYAPDDGGPDILNVSDNYFGSSNCDYIDEYVDLERDVAYGTVLDGPGGNSVSCGQFTAVKAESFANSGDLQAFSFANSEYYNVEFTFNSSVANSTLLFLGSFTASKGSGTTSNVVTFRTFYDGVYQTTDSVTLSTVGTPVQYSYTPISLTVEDPGEHNFTIQFKTTGDGFINVSNSNAMMVLTETEQDTTFFSSSSDSSFTDNTLAYDNVENFSLVKSMWSPFMFFARPSITEASAANNSYYFDLQGYGPFVTNYFTQTVAAAETYTSYSMLLLDSELSNETAEIYFSTADEATVTQNNLMFELKDSSGNYAHHSTGTNASTDTENTITIDNTSSIVYSLEHEVKNSTQSIVMANIVFASVTDEQTVTVKVNASTAAEEECVSSTSVKLTDNADIESLPFFFECKNLTVNSTENFNLYVEVDDGERVVILDEMVMTFESAEWDFEPDEQAPVPNEIISPSSTDNVNDYFDIEWRAYHDFNEDDNVTYNVYLTNQWGEREIDWGTYSEPTEITADMTDVIGGDYVLVIEGCDQEELCSQNTVSLSSTASSLVGWESMLIAIVVIYVAITALMSLFSGFDIKYIFMTILGLLVLFTILYVIH